MNKRLLAKAIAIVTAGAITLVFGIIGVAVLTQLFGIKYVLVTAILLSLFGFFTAAVYDYLSLREVR